MDIESIRTRRDYRNALKRIKGLMKSKRGTPEGDHLGVLVTLVEAWKRQHYPLGFPDPVEAIKYHMDQKGLHPRDLISFTAVVTAFMRCSTAGDRRHSR